MDARILKEEFSRADPMQRRLRYTQALITQMAQTAVSTGTIRSTSSCAVGCC
jgi:hypothetical protein